MSNKSKETKNKSRKTKEIVVDGDISKLSKSLEIITKTYSDGGTTHKIYKNIPVEMMIDETTEKGRKVMAAVYPENHEIYFMEYYKQGIQCYPHGGIKIYNKTLGETRQVYPDAAVKHKNVEYYSRTFEEFD